MEIANNHSALKAFLEKAWRRNASIGFVPTMGALHKGHAALIEVARKENSLLVASIFVNPTQFGPHEDFSRYPRMPDADATLLKNAGVDLLYAPDVSDIYPKNFTTSIQVNNRSQPLCGAFRPGHFDGVALIVMKLFNRIKPTRAYFGEKDWQQLQVIRTMVHELDMGVDVVGVPTVREDDGLALSSRNFYLSAADRARAPLLIKSLRFLAGAMKEKHAAVDVLLNQEKERLTAAGFRLDYLELADAHTCVPTRSLENPTRLFVAAYLGTTRLIDNIEV